MHPCLGRGETCDHHPCARSSSAHVRTLPWEGSPPSATPKNLLAHVSSEHADEKSQSPLSRVLGTMPVAPRVSRMTLGGPEPPSTCAPVEPILSCMPLGIARFARPPSHIGSAKRGARCDCFLEGHQPPSTWCGLKSKQLDNTSAHASAQRHNEAVQASRSFFSPSGRPGLGFSTPQSSDARSHSHAQRHQPHPSDPLGKRNSLG